MHTKKDKLSLERLLRGSGCCFASSVSIGGSWGGHGVLFDRPWLKAAMNNMLLVSRSLGRQDRSLIRCLTDSYMSN